MSISVKLHEEDLILNALAAVRNDGSEINWVILTHHEDRPNVLSLQESGSDGVEGLKNGLSDEKVQYALLRLSIKVDFSTTIKFVYIYNLGDKVSFVKKGRFGIVKGDATKYFTPHHVDFEITSPEELNEEDIVKKLKDAAGTSDHVTESKDGKQERTFTGARSNNVLNATKALSNPVNETPKSSGSNLNISSPLKSPFLNRAPSNGSQLNQQPAAPRPTANKSSGTLTFDEDFLTALTDVRNDKTDCTWVLGAYKDGNVNQPVALVGTGNGSIDELVALLDDGLIAYGIFRVVDMIDGHKTIKFALIVFVGPDVSAMKKAKIVSHRGAVRDKLDPFHVELIAYDKSEVSYDEILLKVQASSGSKSFVK